MLCNFPHEITFYEQLEEGTKVVVLHKSIGHFSNPFM